MIYMPKSAAATSVRNTCPAGAVGKVLAEQPEDPCTAVAVELMRGTGLGERAAALSAARAEQEDGPH